MSKTFIILFLLCTLGPSVSAQVAPELQTLIPGRPVEREIAGGQSHTYRISLTAGQFVRVVAMLMPKTIDLNVGLDAPAFARSFRDACALLGNPCHLLQS